MKRLTARLARLTERQYFYIVTGLLAAAAMLTSLLVGLRQSVWFDEAYSIMLAQHPLPELLRLTALDTHPPLYYVLLKWWAGLAGWSELALRSLSVLALGATIVAAAMLVRRMFNARAAMAATLFMALAPMMLRYGFEIRMYSLAALIGVAATYALVTALATRRRLWWAVYALLVALGMLTLYYLVFVWLAHLVWLVWRTARHQARGERHAGYWLRQPWVAAYVGSVVLFAPWLPSLVGQIGNNALAPIGQPMNIESLIGILSFNFVYHPLWQLDMALTILVLFVVAMVAVVVIEAFRHARQYTEYLALLLSYVMTPVIVLMLISFARPMYVERYLSHVSVALMMLVGVSIYLVLTREDKRRRTVLAGAQLLFVVVLVGMANLFVVGNYNYQRLQKPELKQAATQLDDCHRGAAIVAADPYVAIELNYYLPRCEVRFVSDSAQLAGGYAPLSDSRSRIGDGSQPVKLENRQINYVYYGDRKLRFDDNYVPAGEQRVGALTIEKFSAESHD